MSGQKNRIVFCCGGFNKKCIIDYDFIKRINIQFFPSACQQTVKKQIPRPLIDNRIITNNTINRFVINNDII